MQSPQHSPATPVRRRRIAGRSRSAYGVLVLVAALAATAAPAAVAATPPPAPAGPWDQLEIRVSQTGDLATAPSKLLRCHPTGGTHANPDAACEQLEKATRWGSDPFAPVARSAVCTRIHGGPAVAHVSGQWAGRPVDADFNRTDGCQMSRWDALSEVLRG